MLPWHHGNPQLFVIGSVLHNELNKQFVSDLRSLVWSGAAGQRGSVTP